MNNNNSSNIINEEILVPISELPFQYNNSVISTIETIEKKEKEKEKEKKREKMVKTRKQRKEEKSENSNQHSLEKWFSPNSKKAKDFKDLNNENVTLIDLTENSDTESKNSETTVVDMQEENKDNNIHNENDNNSDNENDNNSGNKKNIVESPYFNRKSTENSKILSIDIKKKNNLIIHNETDDNMDIDNQNITDNNKNKVNIDIKNKPTNNIEKEKVQTQINNKSNESSNSKKTNESNKESIDNEEDKSKITSDNDDESKDENNFKEEESDDNNSDSKDENENNVINIRKASLRSYSRKNSFEIEIGNDIYDKNKNNKTINLRSQSQKEDVDSIISEYSENNSTDESISSTIINGRALRKRPSKDEKKKNDIIKKENNNSRSSINNFKKRNNNRSNQINERNNDTDDTDDIDDIEDIDDDDEIMKLESNDDDDSNRNQKKRRRKSTESEENMKKTKLKSDESEEIEEHEKKVAYKQAALTGFSRIPSTRARAFKTKRPPKATKVKKVIPIPEFHKISNKSVSNRYKNLVIPDILKLLSVSDFLEKFGKYILEMEDDVNFYTIYQAIVYPSPNSFKLLSSIYIALLQYLNKNNTANLIIPINENTWQYYLIPTITNILRIQYGLKRTTMDNYIIPDHLYEFKTKEFYFITPLAHVKTLKQLVSIIADTPQYREHIEGMLDKMIQLSNEKRIEMMQKKIMEEEANDMQRDLNIVGIRIRTLEFEQKKQKEENKKNSSKTKIDHRALSRLHAEYKKKESSLDKMKKTIKKKDESIQDKKKEKIDIKNKVLKGNERFLGIDRNNKYYWVLDIKYQSPNKDMEDGSDSEDDLKKEKNESKKSKPILSFITTDEKGKLALPKKDNPIENIYGIIVEDSSKKRNAENKDDYYNIYNYYDEDIIYNGTYEYIENVSEIRKLINSLQLDDYDEEQLHANIIDFFSSRGYTLDSQTKLGNSTSDINVETSLKNFKEWCDDLGKTLNNVTEESINILNEKNSVMYINRINEVAFALEKDYELPPITIILDDMVSNEKENDNNPNNILRYRCHYIKDITDKIKEIYTNHSDSIPHENIRKNVKHQNKDLETTILSNNDVKLIIKKDKKVYVKFSDYQLNKIDDVNQLSDLYSWFIEIKKILDVKYEKIIGKKPNPKPANNNISAKGNHNLRERKKTNYIEIYYSDDDDFMN